MSWSLLLCGCLSIQYPHRVTGWRCGTCLAWSRPDLDTQGCGAPSSDLGFCILGQHSWALSTAGDPLPASCLLASCVGVPSSGSDIASDSEGVLVCVPWSPKLAVSLPHVWHWTYGDLSLMPSIARQCFRPRWENSASRWLPPGTARGWQHHHF